MTVYTAISFAPVQGFIEKSRKLRDLFGASLILSYLSSKLVQKAECLDLEVISPGLPEFKEGMPNRILVRGEKEFDQNIVRKTLLDEWQKVLHVCRKWLENNVPTEKYDWPQTEEHKELQKAEWERWGRYTWEVFWGTSKENANEAMRDLERRKLKRDWIAINWVGESSSLSGTDAIAWHRLGEEHSQPGRSLTPKETQEQKDFYQQLSQSLESSSGNGQSQGKFLDPSEKLSIPELVKRLVTRYEDIGRQLGKEFYIESFSEMVRLPKPGQPGHWTGWFMGDGDKVGNKLKELVKDPSTQPLKHFSNAMRNWGRDFKRKFPPDLGRVVYAGGDDFLGVIYSKNPKEPISTLAALNWLMGLNKQWNQHEQNVTVSVGFVWAGHSVPQRDILQHCREAEKRAKNLGRNRVTIRVVFNSGQFVQWTCPWDYLHILTKYRDRDGKTWGEKPNWSHIYSDWAQLKSRNAVFLKETQGNIDAYIAIKLFDLYFSDRFSRNDSLKEIKQNYLTDNCKHVTGKEYSSAALIEWIDGLVKVGWQLCSNS